jgi:hypothetical protein
MAPPHVAAASERILGLLRGGAEQRAEAYAALTKVADGTEPCALLQPGATVRVLGLEEGADADAVCALLSQFGEVVACTLCAQQRRRRGGGGQGGASALATFGSSADAHKAVAAEHLSVRSEDVAQSTNNTVLRHQAKVVQCTAVQVLLPCVEPLMEVLNPNDDPARLSVLEFQRGSLVVASMVAVDMILIGGKVCEGGRCLSLGSRPNSHFARVFQKDAADLTADDALTVACWSSAMGLTHCNLMGCMTQGNINELEFLDHYSKACYNAPEYKENIDHAVRLADLLRDLVTDPDDVSPHAAIGGCMLLVHIFLIVAPDGSSPAREVFATGWVQSVVEAVRDFAPPERIKIFSLGAARMWCIKDVCSSAPPEDAIRAVVETGLIDIIVENLAAIHALGDVSQVCVMQYWYGCFFLLSSLDLRLPSAAPIVEKLRASAAAIQWCIGHSVTHMAMLGWSVSAQGTLLAAAAFGRDEGDCLFTFTEENMAEVVRAGRDKMRPSVPVWPMKETQGLELLDLVISDEHKTLLLSTPGFIEQLLDGLLLDPKHPQISDPNTDWEAVKAPVQATHAACLQQLALYGPGRDALQARPDVLEALQTVAQDGWSRPAKIAASGALKALSDLVVKEKDSSVSEEESGGGGGATGGTGGGGGWIMISYQVQTCTCACACACAFMVTSGHQHQRCAFPLTLRLFACVRACFVCRAVPQQQQHHHQWNVQPMIKRINSSLRQRGYTTWLDLEDMRGSTVDAMSDAVDGAAMLLIGVSRAYKESANCRMEASYAHTQTVPMVPMLMQDGYKANGWLGMLLGTRLWYAFHTLEEQPEQLEARMDAMVREIDTICGSPAVAAAASTTVHEGLPPPKGAPAPASAPAPVRHAIFHAAATALTLYRHIA